MAPDQKPLERIVGGRYALHGPIATGGTATVCFGQLLGSGGFSRTVAIKRLRGEHLESPELVSTLIDEARLASRIRHPHVVATLDMIAEDDEVFLVMEYVPGESLARLAAALAARGQRLDVAIAAGIMIGVLEGLHAAHEARDAGGEPLAIVHRDVTPENILVGSDGLARLLDFGIAKGKGRLQTTRAGQLKGKVSYMAPEQILGEEADRRSDVYAAAVVLWEMLTGQRLFPGGESSGASVQLIPRILEADIQPPSTVVPWAPRILDPVVMRALNRERDARYLTARDFAVAIEELVEVAPSRRIAEWLETVAGETLQARARSIAALERDDRLEPAAAVLDDALRRRRDKRRAAASRLEVARTLPEPWKLRAGRATDEDLRQTIDRGLTAGHDDHATTLTEATLDEETVEPATLRRGVEEEMTRGIEEEATGALPSLADDIVVPVRSSPWPWLVAALLLAAAIAAALWLR